MRQIWITKFGPPEVLAIRQAPDPQPKADELRIRVEASGVNFADIVGRVGFYPDLPPIPVVPGYRWRGCRYRLDRPRCPGDDPFRRLCGRDLRTSATDLRPPAKHVRLGSRSASGQLLRSVAARGRHGRIKTGRDRSRAFGGRRARVIGTATASSRV